MSFLLGDDYASSRSSSESDEEETVPSQMMNHEPNNEEKIPVQLLPSADSVLSSVTASFLPPKSSAKAHSTVKPFDLLEEHEAQGRERDKQKREQEAVERVMETRKIDRKRHPPPGVATREESTKREKKDAKERVKHQRLKGQAGIGFDFRGWKSETEMAMRQQFD